ncbi:helix-turn-helix transcriptional regulator [Sphingomonas sp. LaA6.9]|nr:helix-turn-helix transcriptional regulator [Sphingomonas sp. LaA6.9]
MNDQYDGASGLTCREYQILELVAQGYSAKEVAQRIDIAPRTVERHIDNVRLKLQARNRTHMVAKAIAANLLTPTGEKVKPAARDPLVVHIGREVERDLFGYPTVTSYPANDLVANGNRWH